MKRAVLNSRSTQATKQTSSSGGLSGLLNLKCRLTHYTGNGCKSSGNNTFNKVPIIGNLFEADYIPRKWVNRPAFYERDVDIIGQYR